MVFNQWYLFCNGLLCRLLGVDKLFSYAINEWLNDIKKNQLPGLLGGVGPIHSLVQLGKDSLTFSSSPWDTTTLHNFLVETSDSVLDFGTRLFPLIRLVTCGKEQHCTADVSGTSCSWHCSIVFAQDLISIQPTVFAPLTPVILLVVVFSPGIQRPGVAAH